MNAPSKRVPGEPVVKLERAGALALVTLNRPERRNALDQAVVDALHGVLDELQADDSVGAMILTGAGDKAFAAGADIAQLRDRRRREALQGINSRLFQRVEEAPFPVIAAIRGFCLGGGCELALACDLRIAGESARFGQPEVGLGIVPGAGATYRLPRLVGAGKARELVFTGRIVDAAEALRIGLVNQVVPDAEVHAAARKMADDIVKQDRLAVRLAKMLFRLDGSFRPGAGYLGEALAQAVLFESEEKVRRMTEFLDRSKTKK
jgi:enoyl-CoA hydratase